MPKSVRSILSGLCLLAFLWSPRIAAECDKKCYESVEIVECQDARRLGGSNCRIASNCYVGAYDPDGPGGQPPIIFATCTYTCLIDYCMWV